MPLAFLGNSIGGYGLLGAQYEPDIELPPQYPCFFTQKRTIKDDTFKFIFYWGTGATGTKEIGSMFYPNSVETDSVYGSYGILGTLKILVAKVRMSNNESWLINDPKTSYIKYGDSVNLNIYNPFSTSSIKIFLPEITNGTVHLWIGTKGESYYDSAYTQLACGYIGTHTFTESVAIADTKYNKAYAVWNDGFPLWDNFRQNPNRFPVDTVLITERFDVVSYRQQAATSWIMSPSYKVLIDLNDTGEYATTNWDARIKQYSSINKAQKHWSGKYETSEWSPTFADENNELLGSMYSSGYDIRNKTIMLRALVSDTPFTWQTQFTGKIKTTQWQDGLLNLTAQDELQNLVNREFVFDYTCLGTVILGQEYGIVKQVQGTLVYFDDKGLKSTIQRKSKISPNYFQVAFNTGLGIINGISGNWIGAGINAAAVGIQLSKSGERLDSAYIQIRDDNVIPDDSILGQTGVKFYKQAVDGIATNSNNPLYNQLEYNITGGTFCYGLYATVNIDDTTGINVGDYVYVRKPLIYSGDPNTIIKNILTGSNIDFKYDLPYIVNTRSWIGKKLNLAVVSDFSNNWDNELSAYNTLSLYKQIEYGSDPFTEIKELVESCQLYFYIDGDNKFAVSSIDGKDILRQNSGMATYSDVFGNVLSGFSYSRGVEDSYGKLIYKYGYNTNNEFSRKKEFTNRYSQFESTPKTIESKWVQNDDDAFVLGYRAFQKFGTGYETISIPTSLYGLLNNVGDLVRVTHRTGTIVNKTFEIVGQSKDFDSKGITFDAENVEYINNQGLCEWGTSFATCTPNSKSGWSNIGIKSSGVVGTIGSFYGTYSSSANVLLTSKTSPYIGRYIAIGSNSYGNFEICFMSGSFPFATHNRIVLTRGLFNTISRPISDGDKLYDIGPMSLKQGFNEISREALLSNGITGVLFATTYGINPLIGTSFKFF